MPGIIIAGDSRCQGLTMAHAMNTLIIAAGIQYMKFGLFCHSPCNALCVGVVVETSAKTRKDSGGHQQKAFFVLLADTLS